MYDDYRMTPAEPELSAASHSSTCKLSQAAWYSRVLLVVLLVGFLIAGRCWACLLL
jgi:hypothetical protein